MWSSRVRPSNVPDILFPSFLRAQLSTKDSILLFYDAHMDRNCITLITSNTNIGSSSIIMEKKKSIVNSTGVHIYPPQKTVFVNKMRNRMRIPNITKIR